MHGPKKSHIYSKSSFPFNFAIQLKILRFLLFNTKCISENWDLSCASIFRLRRVWLIRISWYLTKTPHINKIQRICIYHFLITLPHFLVLFGRYGLWCWIEEMERLLYIQNNNNDYKFTFIYRKIQWISLKASSE